MTTDMIARKLDTIRADLGNAGGAHIPNERIDSLSIALELLTDIVEHLIADQDATSRRIDAIDARLRDEEERY